MPGTLTRVCKAVVQRGLRAVYDGMSAAEAARALVEAVELVWGDCMDDMGATLRRVLGGDQKAITSCMSLVVGGMRVRTSTKVSEGQTVGDFDVHGLFAVVSDDPLYEFTLRAGKMQLHLMREYVTEMIPWLSKCPRVLAFPSFTAGDEILEEAVAVALAARLNVMMLDQGRYELPRMGSLFPGCLVGCRREMELDIRTSTEPYREQQDAGPCRQVQPGGGERGLGEDVDVIVEGEEGEEVKRERLADSVGKVLLCPWRKEFGVHAVVKANDEMPLAHFAIRCVRKSAMDPGEVWGMYKETMRFMKGVKEMRHVLVIAPVRGGEDVAPAGRDVPAGEPDHCEVVCGVCAAGAVAPR